MSVGAMNPEVKQKFVAALRSGDFPVGKMSLCKGMFDEKRYCALGVLCELAVEAGITKRFDEGYIVRYGTNQDKHRYDLPPAVAKWANLKHFGDFPDPAAPFLSIAGVSDIHEDFNIVADYVERYL